MLAERSRDIDDRNRLKLAQNMAGTIKNILRKLNFLGLHVYRAKGFGSEPKHDYQSRFVNFGIKQGWKILDIGSGGEPFPPATHLVDLYPQETQHRYNKLKTDEKIFTQADVEDLPYKDKEFDFIYCAHVLEHVGDPAKACEEIMRVGRRGYIETPTRASDLLFGFISKKDFHKWHVVMVGDTLIFNEYQDFEKKPIGPFNFYSAVHSEVANNTREKYRENKNLFSNMFLWENKFSYYVFNKSGDCVASNAAHK